MPTEVLYGIIAFLGIVVVSLGGIWVRANDKFREWSIEEIAEMKQVVVRLQMSYAAIEEDIKEIKMLLYKHFGVKE